MAVSYRQISHLRAFLGCLGTIRPEVANLAAEKPTLMSKNINAEAPGRRARPSYSLPISAARRLGVEMRSEANSWFLPVGSPGAPALKIERE